MLEKKANAERRPSFVPLPFTTFGEIAALGLEAHVGAVGTAGQHLVGVEVGRPQPAVPPARALEVGVLLEHDDGFGRHRPTVALGQLVALSTFGGRQCQQ